jgi:hypothetical protein
LHACGRGAIEPGAWLAMRALSHRSLARLPSSCASKGAAAAGVAGLVLACLDARLMRRVPKPLCCPVRVLDWHCTAVRGASSCFQRESRMDLFWMLVVLGYA